tara:strand:+ start:59 stop:277 length:219 start_codon:yes stop_codon:yes gene_type:complete
MSTENLPQAFRDCVAALIDARMPCHGDAELTLLNATADLEDVLADIVLLFTQGDTDYQLLVTVVTDDDEVSQ